MRTLTLLAVLTVASLSACAPPGASASSSGSLLAVGAPAPDVTLRRLDGPAYPLSSLRGKTILLNFWFRGCGACQAEMPHLSELWSEVHQQCQDVAFLSVNMGDTAQVITEWWQKAGFTHLPVMQDGDTVSTAFGVTAYPTNYILGPDGRVLWRGVGYDEAGIRSTLGLKAR